MVDEAQRQRTTFPNEVDALAKQQYDWNRANTEFSRFHAKSDPTAQMYEQAAYEQRGNPGFFNARSPRVFENTQWSPNYPGPKFDTRFIVGSSGSSGGLESLNRGEYYDRMKGSEQYWMDVLKEDVRQRLGISNEPGMEAGITNPNLGGAQVWNAGGPFAGDYPLPGMQWLEHKLFGDPDDTEPPPVGEGGELLPGWELQQDGFNYFPPEFEGETDDPEWWDKYEEGDGWLSNPFEDLRNRDPLNDLFFKRMMEDNLKFQMDMLMNPNKFNTIPGTGDINPIFGDPYWNI